ncbi:hypothetical protein SprV_0100319800 [Sparganum proliferum]
MPTISTNILQPDRSRWTSPDPMNQPPDSPNFCLQGPPLPQSPRRPPSSPLLRILMRRLRRPSPSPSSLLKPLR